MKGYLSALHCLTTETEKLKDMAQRSYRERQELYTKHHKIQEFKDLTVCVIIYNRKDRERTLKFSCTVRVVPLCNSNKDMFVL